ncbi:assimilatory nitrate reductase catalytic subunit/cobaltochelatase CobN [Mesorhizobium albiziae]|uniref:Assimilatory nitrate reductase catalytic subunit/cobaltochelatase CobN n=1 Tax=Neomesorhizobium albiziae TaxID=335020 RepID=A0A1I3WQI1_9HYPH|nr:assimilatory nitrate reductase catalytic subunit/cobaltochelatase CobN [Mesorhizobium albiziae]
MSSAVNTPLWPAGHLPLKGGDYSLRRPRIHFRVVAWRAQSGRLISPLEGEMAGRPEGGVQTQGGQEAHHA